MCGNTDIFNLQSLKKTMAGFTLIELMITIVVGSIAMLAVGSVYVTISRSYALQREHASMQQDLRAAMMLIKNDIRNAGRNGDMTGVSDDNDPNNRVLGIVDVSRFNPDADDVRGYPGITMRTCVDTDFDGVVEKDITRTISYRVFDADGDGRRELRRFDTAGANAWELVFDGIEDISFAYAFDENDDWDLDRSGAGANATVMWGINTDAMVGLDVNADNLPDGDIDERDDTDGDGWIDANDGGLGRQVPLEDIRSVRIWLLARSSQRDINYVDQHTYALGHKIIDMNNAANINRRNFHHELLEGSVSLQNHEREN